MLFFYAYIVCTSINAYTYILLSLSTFRLFFFQYKTTLHIHIKNLPLKLRFSIENIVINT